MLPQKKLLDDSRRTNELAEYRQQSLGYPVAVPPSQPPGQGGMSEGLGKALWRRRWSILTVTLLVLAAAFVYLDRTPKIYTSTARIYLGEPKSAIFSPGGLVSAPIGDVLFTEVEKIKMPAVLVDAATAMNMTEGRSDDDLRHLVDEIRGNLTVDIGRKDSIISVSYDSRDRLAAAKMANAIVEAYTKYKLNSSESNSNEVLKILRRNRDEQDELRKLQFKSLLEFKRANSDFISHLNETGARVTTGDIQSLRSQIAATQLQVIDAEAAYQASRGVADNPAKLRQLAGPGVVAQFDPEGESLRRSLSDVGMRLTVLRQSYPKGSPILKGDEAMEKELVDRIGDADKKFADAYTSALYQQVLRAKQRVEQYQARLEEETRAFNELNGKAAEYEKLTGELDQTNKLLTDLGDKIKTLELSGQASNLSNVQVIEKAEPLDFPSKPAKVRIMGIALAAGLMLGCGLALIRERFDQRIRSADKLAGLLGVPVVGVIPHMRRSLTPVARGQAVHWDPMSDVAEAYRAVRTAVNFGVPAGQSKTIVITSPTPGDGKSTCASNLAIAMAQAGKRVLLLDADFRRPVQHKLFEVNHEVGVTSVLAGRDALPKAIQKTATEGLDLLPSGPIPLNPSELLNGESFAEILDELAGAYDHIVLDCPPVMSVTDARILGAVCDVTILVLRSNKATRKTVEFARAGLASVGARLLGCVMNDVSRAQGADGYYSGYGYAPIEPVVRRREEGGEAGSANGHRKLPSPGAANVR